jgi:hypothetical protein
VVVAAFDLLVDDHAIEALLGRLGDELLSQRDVLLAGETEAVNDALDLVLGVLDALGNLDFLLAGQQLHLPHLLQIHADGIVQDVQAVLVLRLLLRLGLFDPIHFRLIDDLDLQVAELAVDLVQVIRRDNAVGQCVIDVAVGQIALFLGQPQQLLDLFGQIHASGSANHLRDLRRASSGIPGRGWCPGKGGKRALSLGWGSGRCRHDVGSGNDRNLGGRNGFGFGWGWLGRSGRRFRGGLGLGLFGGGLGSLCLWHKVDPVRSGYPAGKEPPNMVTAPLVVKGRDTSHALLRTSTLPAALCTRGQTHRNDWPDNGPAVNYVDAPL